MSYPSGLNCPYAFHESHVRHVFAHIRVKGMCQSWQWANRVSNRFRPHYMGKQYVRHMSHSIAAKEKCELNVEGEFEAQATKQPLQAYKLSTCIAYQRVGQDRHGHRSDSRNIAGMFLERLATARFQVLFSPLAFQIGRIQEA